MQKVFLSFCVMEMLLWHLRSDQFIAMWSFGVFPWKMWILLWWKLHLENKRHGPMRGLVHILAETGPQKQRATCFRRVSLFLDPVSAIAAIFIISLFIYNPFFNHDSTHIVLSGCASCEHSPSISLKQQRRIGYYWGW